MKNAEVEGILVTLAAKPGWRVLHVLDWRGPRYEAPHTVFEDAGVAQALRIGVRLPPDTTIEHVEEVRTGRRLQYAASTGGVAWVDLPPLDGYAAIAVSLRPTATGATRVVGPTEATGARGER